MKLFFVFVVTCTLATNILALPEDNDKLPDNIGALVDAASSNDTYIESSWTPGIGSWEPDPDLREQLYRDERWYIAGYDYDKHPVVVWELGRSKITKYVEGGSVLKEMLYKYSEWKWYTISKLKSPEPDAEDGIFLIVDCIEFHASELTSFEGIKINIFASRIIERIEATLAKVIFVNVNFIGQTWINIVRPVGGRWLGKAEVFGPSKEKWQPVLAQYIPKDQLPPFYGGSLGNEYKPIKVYG